jgi:hypothetical protein
MIPPPALVDPPSSPQANEMFAAVLLQKAKPLQAFDRYERRALSRRKDAVQAFDREITCNLCKHN